MKRFDKLVAYQLGVFGLAVVLAVPVVLEADQLPWRVALFLGLVAFLSEWFAVKLPVVGSVSLSFAVLLASVLLGGLAAGVVCAAVGSVSLADIRERKPLSRQLFNSGQYVAMALAAGALLVSAGVRPLLDAADSPRLTWLVVAIAAAAAMATINMVLVGLAIAMYTDTPLRTVWRLSFRSYTVSMVALALLGVVLAHLIAVADIVGTLLIAIPFGIARQTFDVMRQESEAYRETVRSLVTALEAKDPYTRGHSKRVALYSREIAEQTGLGEDAAQRIEWAALLHDIGKVAIRTSTLTKPSKLTDSEYAVVKTHPTVAIEILQGIDFLADVLPAIERHHERLDGAGYPMGIPDDLIPEEARILAVADCFDAMTSNRAYREALSYEEAVCELRRVEGTQLDSLYVAALLARVDESRLLHLARGIEDRND